MSLLWAYCPLPFRLTEKNSPSLSPPQHVRQDFSAHWALLPQPFPSLTHPSPALLPSADPDNRQQLTQLLRDVAKTTPMHDRANAVLISLSSYSRILIHLYRSQTLPHPHTLLITLPPERSSLTAGIKELILCPMLLTFTGEWAADAALVWLCCRLPRETGMIASVLRQELVLLLHWRYRTTKPGRNLSCCQRGSSLTWFHHLSCIGISNHAGLQWVGLDKLL